MYRKEVFDKLIDRVERRNGKIYLYQGEYPKEGHPMDLLQSFPSHLLESEEEQQVLKIKLKGGGEEYILDLSGAQYGYHEPVISWVDYIESRAGAAWGDIDCKL
jgi:hypothetical protein